MNKIVRRYLLSEFRTVPYPRIKFRHREKSVSPFHQERAMLAQQSPRWVCRMCLSAQSRSVRYRQLTQITTQENDSPDPVISDPHPVKEFPKLEHAKLARRVPLSEILAARAKEKEEKAQALKEKDSTATDQTASQDKGEPTSISSKTAKSKDETTTIPQSATGKLIKAIWDKPNTKSKSTPAKSAASPLVKSLRSIRLEGSKTAFPAAPITLFRKLNVPRHSPLEQIRDRVDGSLVPDPKFHPNDPLNSFLGFPRSATREGFKNKANSEETVLDKLQKTWSEDIVMTPVQPKEFRPIPTLEHGLDRVLFKYVPLS
jgi:hypothetical protein